MKSIQNIKFFKSIGNLFGGKSIPLDTNINQTYEGDYSKSGSAGVEFINCTFKECKLSINIIKLVKANIKRYLIMKSKNIDILNTNITDKIAITTDTLKLSNTNISNRNSCITANKATLINSTLRCVIISKNIYLDNSMIEFSSECLKNTNSITVKYKGKCTVLNNQPSNMEFIPLSEDSEIKFNPIIMDEFTNKKTK